MKFNNIEKRKHNEPFSEQHIIDAKTKLGAVSANATGYILMKEGKEKEDISDVVLKPDHKVNIRSFSPSLRINTDENAKNYTAEKYKDKKRERNVGAKNSKTNGPYREWKNENGGALI